MSETRNGRRISARIAEKEEAPSVNGFGHPSSQPKERTPGKPAKASKGSVANSVTRTGRGKRKQDYDEESDGFLFTRTRAKKTKVVQEPVEEPIAEAQEEPAVAPKKAGRRSRGSRGALVEEVTEIPKKPGRPSRRSARNSGGSVNEDPPPLEVKKKRVRKIDQGDSESRGRPKAVRDDQEDVTLQIANSSEISKIALPFADTPIIRRNKAMRAESGQRRSSLGNRGRRASSLIDSGRSAALPHDEVESAEFYKHIETNIPEPRRMRQLLTWCGTRALGDKPSFASKDSHERLAAREIQQQLLKDFSAKSEFSDWFSRPEVPQPRPQALRPNPLNVANLSQIDKLEKQIARLQTERKQWEALLAPSSALEIPEFSHLKTPHPHTNIDSSILANPSQSSALQILQSCFPVPATKPSQPVPSALPETTLLSNSVATHLSEVASSLEISIDTLASNAHTLSSYKDTAEQVADRILGVSSRTLELRDEEGKAREAEQAAAEGHGNGSQTEIRNVLRGLSRVLEQGQGRS